MLQSREPAKGLVDEQTDQGAQEAFVRDAFERWRSLTKDLPKDSPGCFPHGWYRFDYWLEGELRTPSLTAFEAILDKAVTRHTGWPVFWVPKRPKIAPREVDGTIECWLAPEGHDGIKRGFDDAAHSDFWRAAPTARLFLVRGYQEDSQETFLPGTIMDTKLPIWRMGEALLHAEKLATLTSAAYARCAREYHPAGRCAGRGRQGSWPPRAEPQCLSGTRRATRHE